MPDEISDARHGWVLPDAQLVLGVSVSSNKLPVSFRPQDAGNLKQECSSLNR